MGKSLAEAYGPEEWEFICRMGKSMNDPEQRAAFREMIIEKKRNNPAYSIFTDFPKVEPPVSEKARIAQLYCKPVLEMLKKHVQPKEE